MAAPQETFSEGDSYLHGMDPRAKFIAATVLAMVLAISKTVEVAGGGVVFGLLLILFARLPLLDVGKRLLMVNTFTLFIWFMLPLTYGGDKFLLGPLSLSVLGTQLALLITLKTNGVVCVVMALLSTSTVPEIGRAMRWWKIPEKLCLILVFSYRYLFVIHEEYIRLRRAASMRCFSPGTNLATYRTYGNIVGMTLVHSYNRSRRVGQAMQLRCFRGRFYSLDSATGHVADVAIGAVLVLIAISLFILDG